MLTKTESEHLSALPLPGDSTNEFAGYIVNLIISYQRVTLSHSFTFISKTHSRLLKSKNVSISTADSSKDKESRKRELKERRRGTPEIE